MVRIKKIKLSNGKWQTYALFCDNSIKKLGTPTTSKYPKKENKRVKIK